MLSEARSLVVARRLPGRTLTDRGRNMPSIALRFVKSRISTA